MGRPPSIPAEKKTRIVMSVLAGEMSVAEAVGYGPATSPRESTIDALELANAGYAAWQDFMEAHGIEEPTAVTADLLDPPTIADRRR